MRLGDPGPPFEPSSVRRGPLVLALALALCSSGCTCAGPARLIEGESFVVLMDAAPGSLDPRFALSDYGAKIGQLIFSALVTFDTQDGQPELDLARSIEWSGPTEVVIELRTDAQFHDGHPVTAEDVVYTFSMLEAVGSPLAGGFRGVTVEADGEHTVVFSLPEPRASFIADLRLGIVPAHLLAGQPDGRFGDGPLVGSGPFVFVGRRGEHEVALRANPDYYGGAPQLPAISFRLVRDDNARMLALLGGTADLVQNAIPPLMLPVVRRYDHLELESSPSFKVTYIVFNVRHPVLSDRRVRQAIAYAIDRESIVAQKFGGMARLATGLLAPGHWAHTSDVRSYPYDPERAARLLDAAGYPLGEHGEARFHLVLKVSSNKFRRSIAALMAHQLGRVGIEVEVQSYEWGTFFGDVRSGNFEMATLQWPSVVDPDHFRYVFHSHSIPWEGGDGANRGGYVNARLDDLLDEARRETDLAERITLYHAVQRLVAEEVPYVHLWHEDNIAIVRRGVSGYRMTPNARFRYLAETRVGGR